MLKVWLYAYSIDVTSSRRLEQRIRGDLGFRLLSAGLKPDHWTLNQFRRKHRRALNDVFTQVLEAAREMGLGKLRRVAIDSTWVAANASPDRRDTIEQLRRERWRLRSRIRRWQQRCDRQDEEETPPDAMAVPRQWRRRLKEIPKQLKQLRKSGQKRGSRTDPESRYVKKRGGFVLGYVADVAMSDDHMIVAQRVHQGVNDHGSLAVMTERVEHECGERPKAVLADSGYHSLKPVAEVEAKGIEAWVPDRLLARELAGKGDVPEMNARQQRRSPGLKERRERLRGPTGREMYTRRKALVELAFGVLKQPRGMRQFRCRGLEAVSTEWSLATTAFNLTRIYNCRKVQP